MGRCAGIFCRPSQATCRPSRQVVRKQSLWMYSREKDRPFLKISVVLPNMVTQARTVLERGFVVPGLSSSPQSLMTFESNVLFVLRFMVDCKAPDPPTTRRTVIDFNRLFTHCLFFYPYLFP